MEQHLTITTEEHALSAVLHLPGQGEFPAIVLCHGFMGNKIGMHRLFVKTARTLAQAGYAVLRFDYSGCGDSSGEHRDLSLHRQIRETMAVIDFMSKHPAVDKERLSLLGLSMGGCVAALTASVDPRVTRLILWAPVARPLEDLLLIVGREKMEEALETGTSDFQGFELGGEFFKSLGALHPLEEITRYAGSCLFVHGSGDTEVHPGNAALYYRALSRNYRTGDRLVIIPEADHTFAAVRWERQVIQQTLDFLRETEQLTEQAG